MRGKLLQKKSLIINSSPMSSVYSLHSIVFNRSLFNIHQRVPSSHLSSVMHEKDKKRVFVCILNLPYFYYLQNDQREKKRDMKEWNCVNTYAAVNSNIRSIFFLQNILYCLLHKTHQTDFLMLQFCCKILPCRRNTKKNQSQCTQTHVLHFYYNLNKKILLSYRHAILYKGNREWDLSLIDYNCIVETFLCFHKILNILTSLLLYPRRS